MVGFLLLDADEDLVIYSEMVALTAFLLAVDGYWWWQLVLKDYAGGGGAVLEFKFWQSLSLLGVLAGFWLFGPLTSLSAPVWIWPAMVLGPAVILVARMMMGFAGWKR